MKIKIFLIIILFFALCAKSQTPFYKFYSSTKGFIQLGNSNFRNDDGGYTMAGIIYLDTLGNFGINIIKINSEGDILDEKVIKETVIPDLPFDFLQPTFDNGCILASEKKIIKLDSSFNIQWSKQYYSSKSISYGYTVQQTSDSGYIASTDLIDTSDFSLNNILIKLSNNGVIQWSSKFKNPNFAYKMKCNKQTGDGGYITCTNQDYQSAAIVKRNHFGQIQWSKNIDLLNFYDLLETVNGDIFLTGLKFNTFSLNRDVILMKMNNAGTILWSKIYRGSSALNAEQIELGNNGELIISGKISKSANNIISNIFCLKTDNSGNIIWAKKYGTSDSVSTASGNISFSKTLDGGAFISYNHANSIDDLFFTLNAINTDSLGNISCTNFQSNLLLNTIDTTYSISNLSLLESNIQMITTNYLSADTLSPLNVIDCSVIGLPEEIVSKLVDVYPNPNQGKFSIKLESHQNLKKVEVYNTLGGIIYSSYLRNYLDSFNIDISPYPSGIYFIKILTTNRIYTSKIIKQD